MPRVARDLARDASAHGRRSTGHGDAAPISDMAMRDGNRENCCGHLVLELLPSVLVTRHVNDLLCFALSCDGPSSAHSLQSEKGESKLAGSNVSSGTSRLLSPYACRNARCTPSSPMTASTAEGMCSRQKAAETTISL